MVGRTIRLRRRDREQAMGRLVVRAAAAATVVWVVGTQTGRPRCMARLRSRRILAAGVDMATTKLPGVRAAAKSAFGRRGCGWTGRFQRTVATAAMHTATGVAVGRAAVFGLRLGRGRGLDLSLPTAGAAV